MKVSETHRYEIHTSDGTVAGAIYVRIYFNGPEDEKTLVREAGLS